MRKRILACTALAVLVACNKSPHNAGQPASAKESAEPIQGGTPTEVVDQLWLLATQGQLLTPQGWERAGQLCTDPTTFTEPKVIFIVSNQWGPAFEHGASANKAGVTVVFNPVGSLDTALHYTPEPKSHVYDQAVVYDLAAVPISARMYGADGKTLISTRSTGSRMWKVKGSQGRPFTTVNTAIRYILAKREKTQDNAIKKNADETLRILMRLD